MKLTRKGVFETNSSSTHSLVYSAVGHIDEHRKKELVTSLIEKFRITQAGVLHVNATGEYGWENGSYLTALDKLNYLAAVYCYSLRGDYNSDTGNYSYAKEEFDQVPFVKHLIRLLSIKRVQLDMSDSGYVDHGENKQILIEALNGLEDGHLLSWFDDESATSAIYTGNDNDDFHWERNDNLEKRHPTVKIVTGSN